MHDRLRASEILTRREAITLVAGAMLPWASEASAEIDAAFEPLKTRAAKRGMFFGCGVSAADIQKDPAFRQAVLEQCAEIVPTVEMKWGYVERAKGLPDYSAADAA